MRETTLNDAGELLDPDGSHNVRCKCDQCWLCGVCDTLLNVDGSCPQDSTHTAAEVR